MLRLDHAPLALSQADAVACALMAEAALSADFPSRPVCLGCGRDIDRARLAVYARATRCSLCAGIPCLARRR